MKKRWIAASALAAFAAAVFLGNTSLFTPAREYPPLLLAHRGVAQDFRKEGVTNTTCTASRIYKPTNPFLENTLRSLAASFRAGADIAELDVHPTTDGQFAVFHDWTIDCRTNGHGVTREHSMRYLKTLDIGYGYTADGGKTYPFRGKGIGLMPTLDEVLAKFPDRRLLLNVKSNDAAEGERLAARLLKLPQAQRANIMVYGGNKPIAVVRARVPGIRTMSPRGNHSLVTCLTRYGALGWTGYVPEACRNSLIVVPMNVAPWLWGWPGKFNTRMEAAGSLVFVAGPYANGNATGGVDTREQYEQLPIGHVAGIWTDEIETIAPLALGGKRPHGL